MRATFTIIFIALAIVLAVTAYLALRSRRRNGRYVALMLVGLFVPVVGNALIVSTDRRMVALIGSYIYFLGMDLAMFALIRFTLAYCRLSWSSDSLRIAVYALLCIDAVQLLLNPVFGHAFALNETTLEGRSFYALAALQGQSFHRLVDYSILFGILLVFFFKMSNAPRIYMERYASIFFSIILTGLWETYYIASNAPIDRSMIGFAMFGILVFYFALYYKPFRLLDSMLASIASENRDAIFFFDAAGRCIWANRSGIRMAEISSNDYEMANTSIEALFGDLDLSLSRWPEQGIQHRSSAGRYYLLEKHITMDSRRRPSGSFLTIRDNTEEQEELRREKYNATHDTLTGLYTKEHLYECIRKRMEEEPDTLFAVQYVDVKDFKIVNDIFGSDFGDYALTQIADAIRRTSPEDSLYGRLGGDTFGVFTRKDELDVEAIDQLLSSLVVRMGGKEHLILIHVGVYEIPERDLEVSVMFDRAKLALTTIKKDYRTHFAYYDDKMREKVLWNQQISAQLREAIESKQIRPYLQPIVDMRGQVVGAEALVRWIHPTEGFLSPASFIPVFEENGMITEIDRYMWRCACELLATWKDNNLFLSVNVSPKDFYFMDVAAEIIRIVREYGVDPARLRVEITESVMMSDNDEHVRVLEKLRSEGFLVEMDDFGSGYSSLNMLKDMPVGLIKLDMVFLSDTSEEKKARRILKHIINLSNDLGIQSLTEGVETEEQYRMLSSMGCKLFQGYFFAKPMPAEEFIKYSLVKAG